MNKIIKYFMNKNFMKIGNVREKKPFGQICSLEDEGYDPIVLEEVEDETKLPLI